MVQDTNKRLQEYNTSLQQYNSNLQADASKSGETVSKLQKEKSAMMETMAILRESNSSMGNQLESSRVSISTKYIWSTIYLILHAVIRETMDYSVNLDSDLCRNLFAYVYYTMCDMCVLFLNLWYFLILF